MRGPSPNKPRAISCSPARTARPGGRSKAIATCSWGVIRPPAAFSRVQQLAAHQKTPADDPEGLAREGSPRSQVQRGRRPGSRPVEWDSSVGNQPAVTALVWSST